jgi:hypothetical protein
MAYDYDRREAARPIPINKGMVQNTADKIIRELPKHMKFRDLSSPLYMTRGWTPKWGFYVGVYETTDVQGYPVNVPVEVGSKSTVVWDSPRRWVDGGAVKSRYRADGKGKAKGYGSKWALRINFNSNRSPQDILDNLSGVKRELISVLSHEVTHLRDLLRHKGDAHEDSPDAVERYYNEPTELRAFMRQVVDEVLAHADEVGRDTEGFGLYLNNNFVDRALESSATWDRIRKHLFPKNRNLLLKAVVRSLQDAWPGLQRKYPVEEI